MKKALFSLCLLLAIFTRTNAQYVTIPDTNFVNYLTAHYPSAMVGNMMDTTNVNVVGATSLNISNLGISNIDGVQYFDSLNSLNAYNNNITSLPNFQQLFFGLLDLSSNNLLYKKDIVIDYNLLL